MTPPERLKEVAVLLAILEQPALRIAADDLEVRVGELLAMGEDGMRRLGLAIRAQRQN